MLKVKDYSKDGDPCDYCGREPLECICELANELNITEECILDEIHDEVWDPKWGPEPEDLEPDPEDLPEKAWDDEELDEDELNDGLEEDEDDFEQGRLF